MRSHSVVQHWQICGIYMYGLFGSANFPERRFEEPFRERFEKVALERRCRIAVPFGNRGTNRNWHGVGIAEVRSRAQRACGNAALSPHMSIVAFSNRAI